MRAVEKMAGEKGKLTFRRLKPEEHCLTRRLYETVFSEDTKEFVDYYYGEKASRNEIYAALDQRGIHGMVHLNPCQVSWRGETLTIHYIVAVATEESYRRRGIMGTLLRMALRELNRRGEPFAYLMPAAEAIYTPYGFRRTWEWRWEEETVSGIKPDALEQRSACRCSDELLEQLSRRVNERLAGQFELFSLRSAAYYRDLQRQQRASGGELRICFDREGPCFGLCTEKEKFPPMMARIANLESFLARVRTEEEQTLLWEVKDEIIPENAGLFWVELGPEGGRIGRPESEDPGAAPKGKRREEARKTGMMDTEDVSQISGIWRAAEILQEAEIPREENLDIARIPRWLEQDDPFLKAMICEVV